MSNLKLIVSLFGLSYLADANPMPTRVGDRLRPLDLMQTPAPQLGRRALQKRGYVPVCPSGQVTGCPSIGINEITSVDGGQYIPECDSNGSCHWIGYATPTISISGSTTYELVTSTGEVYVVPVPIIPIVGEIIPPPPPLPPADLPEAEEGEPVEDPDPDLDCTSLPLSFDPAPFSSAFQVASTLIDWWGQFGDFDFSAESSTAAAQNSSATVLVQDPSSVPASATVSAQNPSCVSTTTTFSTGPATYCTCGETMAALYTLTTSNIASAVCAMDPNQILSTWSVPASALATTTAPAAATPTPSCYNAGASLISASMSALVTGFCTGHQRAIGSPYYVDKAAPSAGYHDIPNLLGGGTTTLDVIWVTIITTRQGCASATFSFDASTDACLSNMGAITSACAQGGIVTAPSANSCFDFGVSAQLVSNS